MDKAEAIAAARTRLEKADYHLRKLREVENETDLVKSEERFNAHFSAGNPRH
jgi:hypothetical protein